MFVLFDGFCKFVKLNARERILDLPGPENINYLLILKNNCIFRFILQ
jgi:hypothetical protein